MTLGTQLHIIVPIPILKSKFTNLKKYGILQHHTYGKCQKQHRKIKERGLSAGDKIAHNRSVANISKPFKGCQFVKCTMKLKVAGYKKIIT